MTVSAVPRHAAHPAEEGLSNWLDVLWWRDREDRGHRNRLREPFRRSPGYTGTATFGAVFAAHWVQTVFLVAAPACCSKRRRSGPRNRERN